MNFNLYIFFKKVLIAFTFGLFAVSCNSPAGKVQTITSDYCKCVNKAVKFKEKAKCLKEATKKYLEVSKEIPLEDLEEVKQSFQKGLKKCKD